MSMIDNPRARFDYEILEEFEAGLELFGYEARSLRAKQGSLRGARVVVRGGEAFLVGATIPAWQQANTPKSYDPERPRRLLLNKKEIARIAAAEDQDGLTAVPISLYNRNRYMKLSVGIARGKKKADKRVAIAKRETERSIRRTLKTE
jgi:SsrA-binding protein